MNRIVIEAKRLVPSWAKDRVRGLLTPKSVWRIERELGEHILHKAREFSMQRGGRPEALDTRRVLDSILHQRCLEAMSECHQHLQTAFMRDYRRDLYEYYRLQQYLILLAFLGYPFRGRGCLASYTQPYLAASSDLPKLRILDYGAGIPFGLVHLLRACPGSVEAVTLVDLDLIHVDLVEHILSAHRSSTEVTIIRVTDSQVVPELGDRTFNMIYGKDIFEHLEDPERHLRAMLARAERQCHCFFDLNDHGSEYLQHVHPGLSHLASVPLEFSFVADGRIARLSKFVRRT